MKNVTTSNFFKGFFLFISVCCCAGYIFADNDVREKELSETKKILELLLERSPQVVVGHFDSESIDVSRLNINEPVGLPFIIEKIIKWQGETVEELLVPVPYKLFVLRTEKAKDDLKGEWRNIEAQYHKKKAEFSQGRISESEWQKFMDMRKGFFSSRRSEMSFLKNNWSQDSFSSDIKYVIFFYRPIGTDIDWERMVSTRIISLDQGVWADLLLDE
ncbi:MAG: hypothetical protein KBT53_09805 [Porticoccus sp.]|nr:hypothetical protein [Porticoccus sp.]